jgi:hypothetical protein
LPKQPFRAIVLARSDSFLSKDSPMSRRKHLAARSPSGRLKPAAHLMAPTQVRRLVDLAAEDTRHQALGSMAGRLYLAGKISATEFASGVRWREIVANYSIACRSPPPPKSVLLDARGGTGIDSNSSELEIKRHEQANRAWIEGRNALRLAAGRAEQVVDAVCARECAPCGYAEYTALRDGLQALSILWSGKRKARAR